MENNFHESELIAVGKITRTQGNAGAVRLLPFFSPPDRLEELRSRLTYISTTDATAPPSLRELHISAISYHKQFIILRFEEICDMNAAEDLRGHTLYVREQDLWELEDGEFYAYRLIGLSVVDKHSGDSYGEVVAVEDGTAHDYLRVKSTKTEFLIPFVRAMVHEINFPDKRIIVDLPPGLTEL
jgi:16S rRNA processing protein RimM